MGLLIFQAVLGTLPATYELDYSVLPEANMSPPYEYTIILSFPGEPDVKITRALAGTMGREEITSTFVETFSDPQWKIKRNGFRVTIYGYDDVLTGKIVVEGKGPKPLVRRVPYIPTDKKNKG